MIQQHCVNFPFFTSTPWPYKSTSPLLVALQYTLNILSSYNFSQNTASQIKHIFDRSKTAPETCTQHHTPHTYIIRISTGWASSNRQTTHQRSQKAPNPLNQRKESPPQLLKALTQRRHLLSQLGAGTRTKTCEKSGIPKLESNI
jgi:hypothetical protein